MDAFVVVTVVSDTVIAIIDGNPSESRRLNTIFFFGNEGAVL